MKELIYWQQVRDYGLGEEAERDLLLTWSKGNAGMVLGKELLHFAQEIVSPLLEEAPMDFFLKWLTTPFMHWVGADPFRRGAFAREAGFTEHMLGLWNRLHARSKIVDAAVAMYDGSDGGIGDLKRAAKELIKEL